jgi:hypothetical protein
LGAVLPELQNGTSPLSELVSQRRSAVAPHRPNRSKPPTQDRRRLSRLLAALAGRALLRNTVATSHPRPLGVSSPKLPRFRPARLPYCPVQAILRWVLITPTRKDPSAVTAASGSKAGAQQIEVRARCSDCAACDGKRELISSPWGSERVLSARFWSQHASQRGPPQHDTADQTSGMCEKERTLVKKSGLYCVPARAVPRYLSQRIAAADSPIRDSLKKIRIERGCAHAAKCRPKVVR